MKKSYLSIALLMLVASSTIAGAADKKVDVNLSNIRTVETHLQFANYQKITGGINTWQHVRQPVDIDKQSTIAMNRDTFYSFAVLDLAKPVTITMPDMKDRYMSLQLISEGHYTPFVYQQPGAYQLTQKNVGSRYAFAAVRTFVDPNDSTDIKDVHALQDALKIEAGSSEAFQIPNYDMERYKALAANIQKLIGFWNGDTRGAMGTKDQVDELLHTVATIAGWGLQPPENAMYQVVNTGLDETKNYKLEVPANVPVKAFWSISMYNAKGYFQKNKLDAYSLNNVTVKDKNADGSVTIHLGGCEDGRSNCLPIAGKGFYYQWRMYDPEQPIIDGKWRFPDPVVVK